MESMVAIPDHRLAGERMAAFNAPHTEAFLTNLAVVFLDLPFPCVFEVELSDFYFLLHLWVRRHENRKENRKETE